MKRKSRDMGNAVMKNGRHMSTAVLVDTTLRDGAQAPGVVFSMDDKLAILEKLNLVGIEEVEIGTPSANGTERLRLRQLVAAAKGLGMLPFCWCRGLKEDIDAAEESGCEAVHFSLPVSDIQMRAMGMTKNDVLEKAAVGIEYAARRFKRVSIGAQDATRAAPTFLLRFAKHAAEMGAARIRIADTVGIALPDGAATLVRRIKRSVPKLQVEFHGHNDFGMAVANTIYALDAGADAVSVTVLGLGERAGNASLETVVLALLQLKQIALPVCLEQIYPLCKLVEQVSGRAIPEQQPLVGGAVWTHESGIHVRGQLSDPRCYEPFSGTTIGCGPSEYRYSGMSGRAAVRRLFLEAGLNPSSEMIERVQNEIRDEAEQRKRSLTEPEALEKVRVATLHPGALIRSAAV